MERVRAITGDAVTPKMVVLGVYKPKIPRSVYREQWRVTGSDELTDEHFRQLVLIEAQVENIDGPLKMIDLGQLDKIRNEDKYFQCAYDEALLSADGTRVIKREMNCVKGDGALRFAFYLHLYDPKRPLHWSYGEVQCPPVEPVPKRLKRLVPYNACS